MSFRWGMVGHGAIGATFADAMAVVDEAEIVAVAGRDAGRARAFATERGIPVAVVGVEGLLGHALDAVYVCTPHTGHHDAAAACLRAGVPVLVEKPLTPTADLTRRLVDTARASGVFLMEAMWTRFLPVYGDVRRWVDDGRIGEVLAVDASFGFRAPVDRRHRLFAPDLAGGSVLDVGVYPLALGQWLFGGPAADIRAVGTVGVTGVDEHVAMVAAYGSGAIGRFASAVRVDLDDRALIHGSEGRIEIPRFWSATTASLRVGDTEESESHPHRANGFEYQIEETIRCVGAGRTESEGMPWSDSIAVVEACDRVRHQLGVRYPFEAPA